MSYSFLLIGSFEEAVRIKLGVTSGELSNAEINNNYIGKYAEKVILDRVPGYSTITDPFEKLFIQNAIIAYICYILCPSLSRKLNNEVLTIDVTWKKSKVDWLKMAQHFLAECEESLSKISSLSVSKVYDYPIGGISNFGGE